MKFLKYLLMFAVIGCFSSCEKFLDTEPSDSLSSEFYYNTETELNNALTGVYDVLGSEGLYGNAIFTTLHVATDLSFYRRNNISVGVQVLNYDASATEIRSMWAVLYDGINRANLLLENINKPQMDDANRNVIKGEALFLRAYYYFLLVSNWGDVPLVLSSKVSLNATNVARTSSEEVYAFILKDMEEAEGLVKDIRSIGYGGRVSKSAVRGILARVNLYMAGYPLGNATRYPEALKWAQKVINDASAGHSLNPSYSQIFINYAQDKYDINSSIWEVEFWGNRIGNAYLESGRLGNTNGVQCGDMNEGYSYGFVGATSKLYNLYDGGDVRRDWAVAPYSYKGQTSEKVAWKATDIYQRMDGKFRRGYELIEKQKNYTPQNFPLLRYADVLLMAAEAENAINGPTELAHQMLNFVRERAGAIQYNDVNGNTITISDDFLKVIQDERARELCFEALRVNDLKRWGLYLFNLKAAANEFTQRAPAGFKYAALSGNNVAERHLLFPIPLHEISLNSLLTQNPGW